jgi:glycosyltransferase involved in cell wall biosynthesis
LIDFETKTIRAEAVFYRAKQLKAEGLNPDLIISNPGWGESLFVKEVWPQAKLAIYCEFFYQVEGGDVGFDPEFPPSNWQDHVRLALRRSFQLLCLDELDVGVAPTWWQWSTVPVPYRDRVQVIHEGIDTIRIQPNPQAFLQLKAAGIKLKAGDPVVTFVCRNLEPYRGIHRFMRMLPLLQRLNPDVRVVIVGEAGVSYGTPPPGGGTWKQALLQELGDQLDLTRIHFVVHVPHPVLHALFQLSACHVYLTYPFVLSWSLLEAMACGLPVIMTKSGALDLNLEQAGVGL